MAENAAYKKMAEEYTALKAAALSEKIEALAKETGGIKLVRWTQAGTDVQLLREALTALQKKAQNTAVVAAFENAGKPQIFVMYSQDLVNAGHNAGADIRQGAKFIQGGGGGQNGLASAGGKNLAGLEAAADAIIAVLLK